MRSPMPAIRNWTSRFRFDQQTLLLFLFAVGNLVLSMAFFYRESHPPVLVYDPSRGYADLVTTDREQNLKALFRGGFLRATQIATGSWPFDLHQPGQFDVSLDIMRQTFSPDSRAAVRKVREKFAPFMEYGSPILTFSGKPEHAAHIRELDEGFYFESFFTQTVPLPDGQSRLRGFLVKAKALLTPVTEGNPYNLKFTAFHIQEITLTKPSN